MKLEWVDTLKFVGIIAVIMGHIASPLGTFIFSWHMPLFFMLAGFFIKTDLSVDQFLEKDFKRLMVPYFIFACMGLMLETIKRLLLHRESLEFSNALSGVFIWMDMDTLIESYAFVLWFLPALFFARILTYLMLKSNIPLVFQWILVVISFIVSFYIQLPLAIDNAFNSFIFVYFGYFLFKLDNQAAYWPFMLLALVAIYLFNGIPKLNMSQKQYGNVLINIGWAVACIYLLIGAVKNINYSHRLIVLWGGEYNVAVHFSSLYK